MKTDKNYRLPKTAKRIMCSMINDNMRNSFKNAMIDAHLYEVASRTKSKKSKNDRDET